MVMWYKSGSLYLRQKKKSLLQVTSYFSCYFINAEFRREFRTKILLSYREIILFIFCLLSRNYLVFIWLISCYFLNQIWNSSFLEKSHLGVIYYLVFNILFKSCYFLILLLDYITDSYIFSRMDIKKLSNLNLVQAVSLSCSNLFIFELFKSCHWISI